MKPSHLVIVCGHGTYRGEGDVWDEASWILEPFRRADAATNKPSEHYTFVQHIICGASILEQDPEALLIFSGGITQDEQVLQSEGQSYHQAFMSLGYDRLLKRTAFEYVATDSYQNLLFSLLVFRYRTGVYPSRITVITHAFKERRFLNCHAPAIRWPADRIRTIGINPAFTLAELNQVHWGENENAFRHFVEDPYGVKPHLAGKRERRGFKQKTVFGLLLRDADKDVKPLIKWNGGPSGNQIYQGRLPWC